MREMRIGLHQWLQCLLLTCSVILISGAEIKAPIKTINFPRERMESVKILLANMSRSVEVPYHDIPVTSLPIRVNSGKPLLRHRAGRMHRPRRISRNVRNRVPRPTGVSWAEWGACNASCGVGFERREGSCSFGGCSRRRPTVEWKGCIGIKCNEKKGRGTSMVLYAVVLITGFLGGVVLTTVFLRSSWILDQIDRLKKRSLLLFQQKMQLVEYVKCLFRKGEKDGATKTNKAKDDMTKRPPASLPHQKNKEPSYVDVRDLNTNLQDNSYFNLSGEDEDDEDGYLIPANTHKKSDKNGCKADSDPEYIDVIE